MLNLLKTFIPIQLLFKPQGAHLHKGIKNAQLVWACSHTYNSSKCTFNCIQLTRAYTLLFTPVYSATIADYDILLRTGLLKSIGIGMAGKALAGLIFQRASESNNKFSPVCTQDDHFQSRVI